MTTPYQDRPLPGPMLDTSTTPFFEAAKEGRLMIARCTQCRQPHWYPRPLCPYCLGDTAWETASGRGTVYSYSVARRMGPVPYAMAYVRLEEGVTMLTNIVDADLDTIHIDQPVEVTFKPMEDGWMMPMFRPVEGQTDAA
ncbi:hypothetical protein BV96_02984 [Sphingomonas paucimobilis]|nr:MULTISPECIES: OB-fold domain-containing protein [Sphingobium]EZP71146.1 hypothetical protein BV96_02984 [Sphingomonas paucimobilis]